MSIPQTVPSRKNTTEHSTAVMATALPVVGTILLPPIVPVPIAVHETNVSSLHLIGMDIGIMCMKIHTW